ncbi:MAG: nucleotidyltransferase family protein [Deltaproteobacteria bacterium]|nr:nucleotidyltransferase family protein [Deltaproteobacteria bacterium]MBI3017760.1 nucleotidyltransferase family protein [Deltaproteobacteria bacterium]
MRAMILAAGLGTRMRPLTYHMPKPMVPVLGKPLIRHVLDVLKKAGIREVIVNLHHLPLSLKKYLRSQKDFKIFFSLEPKILGTGGGILKAKKFFQNQRFVVINSDILTDVELKKVLAFHIQKKSLATMVVRQMKPHETYEAVGIHPEGKIVKFQTKDIRPPILKTMFTGIHIFEPEIFQYFPKDKKFFCINTDVYAKLVQKNKNVYGYLHKGKWTDMGSLEFYLAYQAKHLKGKKRVQFERILKKFKIISRNYFS